MRPEPKPGDVFAAVYGDPPKHRRILAVGNGHCIFSDGGDQLHECKLTNFYQWIRNTCAEKVYEGVDK